MRTAPTVVISEPESSLVICVTIVSSTAPTFRQQPMWPRAIPPIAAAIVCCVMGRSSLSRVAPVSAAHGHGRRTLEPEAALKFRQSLYSEN